MPDLETVELANMIYGEVGSLDYDTMVMAGSTALNRVDANRPKEFGSTLSEVINYPNVYYAVQNQNDPYTWATSGKFPNAEEEARYKKALSVAYGLRAGTIDRREGHFFFTDKDVKRLKKKGKRAFDFTKVKSLGKQDKYNIYSY